MRNQIDVVAKNFQWPYTQSNIRSLDLTPKSSIQEIVDYFKYTLNAEENLYFFNDEECKEQIAELQTPIIQLGIKKLYCKKSRIMLINQNGQQRIKVNILINNIQQKQIELFAGCTFQDLLSLEDIQNILQDNSYQQIVISNRLYKKIENEQIYIFTSFYQPYYFNIIIEKENKSGFDIQQSQKDQKQMQKSISYAEESTKSQIEEWKKIILYSDHLKWKQQNGTELNQLIITVDTKKKISEFKTKMKKYGIISFQFNMAIYIQDQYVIMEDYNTLDYYNLDDETIIYIEKI